jgi:hypothetical protein
MKKLHTAAITLPVEPWPGMSSSPFTVQIILTQNPQHAAASRPGSYSLNYTDYWIFSSR